MTRRTGRPRLLRNGSVVEPDSIDLQDRRIDEGWLQDLLDRHPGLLPIDEIGPSWGPLISLGREIPLPVGSIDNLFVSPDGEMTVVETKLWRNPEARRKVIGQILDYASCLAGMSYEELDDAVSRATGGQVAIWSEVSSVGGADEANFHDVVTENLAAGRFLLLIVGDGIRADLEAMADLLTGHPHLAFHLEMVELKLYGDGDDLLVVPSLVGRTAEISRLVVEVNGGQARITQPASPEEVRTTSRARPLPSIEAFVEEMTAHTGLERAEAASAAPRK